MVVKVTTIEQSKRILAWGLPERTADMYWSDLDDYKSYTPAWSLNALLTFLPKGIDYNPNSKDAFSVPHYYSLCFMYDDDGETLRYGYYTRYHRFSAYSNECHANDIFDAVMDLIEWLIENGYHPNYEANINV